MKTLVLGVSTNKKRYAAEAVRLLVLNKHEVVAIGKEKGEIHGVQIQRGAVQTESIDTVTLYLNQTNQQFYYTYIINLKPRRVLFNPGTYNPEFERLLKVNHIYFERVCTLTLLQIGRY